MSLAYYFNQLPRIAPGNISGRGNAHYPRDGFAIAATENDFISNLYHVSRFHRPPIEQNKARIAKLLSHRTTRAKTADFKKNVESHSG